MGITLDNTIRGCLLLCEAHLSGQMHSPGFRATPSPCSANLAVHQCAPLSVGDPLSIRPTHPHHPLVGATTQPSCCTRITEAAARDGYASGQGPICPPPPSHYHHEHPHMSSAGLSHHGCSRPYVRPRSVPATSHRILRRPSPFGCSPRDALATFSAPPPPPPPLSRCLSCR